MRYEIEEYATQGGCAGDFELWEVVPTTTSSLCRFSVSFTCQTRSSGPVAGSIPLAILVTSSYYLALDCQA